MITTDSPILGTGSGVDIRPSSVQRDADFAAYQTELVRLCKLVGFNSDILIAQSAHETNDWRSSWWRERLNPAGIGITGDLVQNAASPTFANGTDAARAHVVHMALYAFGSPVKWSPSVRGALYQYRSLDPRFNDVALAGFSGSVKVLGDLGNGKWAVDPNYAEKIAAKASQLFKEETMALYAVAGLPVKIELPVPLIIDLIPKSQTRQRPGIIRQTPGYWVQHETDNPSPGADAEMHSRYLKNGAEGRQASWHFTVDDGVIYQHLPVNEVGWHAADGGGPGNMSGIGCELCINVGIDIARSRHNAEALCGGIMNAQKMTPDRIKRHWDFNAGSVDRHHCPDRMMNSGYWPTFTANATKIITTPPPAEYADPAPISWEQGDVGTYDLNGTPALAFLIPVKVTAASGAVPVSSSAEDAKPTGPKLPTGEELVAIGSYRGGPHRNAYVVIEGGSRVIRTKLRPLCPLPG